MTEAPVHIVPYDPSWIEKFEIEKDLLESLFEPWPWRRGPIEHVGSTAVLGLCAKPVIDIRKPSPAMRTHHLHRGEVALHRSRPSIGIVTSCAHPRILSGALHRL